MDPLDLLHHSDQQDLGHLEHPEPLCSQVGQNCQLDLLDLLCLVDPLGLLHHFVLERLLGLLDLLLPWDLELHFVLENLEHLYFLELHSYPQHLEHLQHLWVLGIQGLQVSRFDREFHLHLYRLLDQLNQLGPLDL